MLGADTQLLSVLAWLLILTFLQLSLWPYLKKTFGDLAFPVAFPASVLVFTLVSWYCGQLHIPVQVAMLPFLGLFFYAVYREEYSFRGLRKEWKWEFLFLVCFLFMLNVRFVNPSISYAEKFMDHGFIASIMRDPVVPPLDPWFSGGYMTVYYYLGYWALGALGVVSMVPSQVVFNLALPTVFALSAVSMYALGHLLLDRFRWLPLLTFLALNPSFFYEVLRGTAPASLFWNSTRTIPNAINEYPLFSLLWGDVHPHIVGMFNQVFLILLLVFALRKWGTLGPRGRWAVVALSALSLGAMPLLNTWDILIYAPFMVLFGLLIWHGTSDLPVRAATAGRCKRLLYSAANALSGAIRGFFTRLATAPARLADAPWGFLFLVPPLAILLWLPFYFQIETQGIKGIGIVTTPTFPLEFLLVHGIFIAILFVYLARDILKRPYLLLLVVPFVFLGYYSAAIALIPLVYLVARWNPDPVEILGIAGLAILVFCEFFYLKDNMGEVYYRMNTVFKFYFIAWLMLGASGFAMLARMLSPRIPRFEIPRPAKAMLILVIGVGFLLLPLFVPVNLGSGPRTLDGLAWVETDHPGDAAAVEWLRAQPGSLVIVEAENGDYTYYSRISSFTGIPSVIGWPFHEFMWRNDPGGWYGTRMNDVRSIYENPQESVALMKKYNASFLVVGEPERSRYQVSLDTANLTRVFDRDGVEIYVPVAP